MLTIVPTITTDNQIAYDADLQEFIKFTKRVHVDVSDGSLAPTSLLPLSGVHGADGVSLDIHLMSAKPSTHLAEILRIKPSLCIIHAEVDDDVPGFFNQLRAAGIRTGIALLKGTFPKKVQDFIALADHVMIFAGELGKQGGAIDMLQTEKVPLIRAIKPELEIAWDGGINLTNIRAIAHSGVDVADVGSAISQAPDKAAMYQALLVESEKKGVLI